MEIQELLAELAPPHPEPGLTRQNLALLLVDMQRMASVEYLIYKAKKKGIPEDLVRTTLQDMEKRFHEARQNAGYILKVCREKDIAVAHTKIEALTKGCRDVGRNHRMHGHLIPPGSEWSEFSDEVQPADDEIILTKTCSSFFTGTSIDRVLRNIGVDNIIIVGFYTEQCVTTTARDAADSGYYVYVASDAVATTTQEIQDHALAAIQNRYAKILNTQEMLERLKAV